MEHFLLLGVYLFTNLTREVKVSTELVFQLEKGGSSYAPFLL